MKQLIRLMGVLLLVAAGSAFAGTEMYSGKESKAVAPAPPPECDFTWTGFYFGGNAGYAWGDSDTHFDPRPDAVSFFSLEPRTLHPDPDGFIGGGQLGYNWQWNKWLVLGFETDFQGADIEGHEKLFNFTDITGAGNGTDTFLSAHERIQWLGTVRGRLGFAPICRLLIYGTGGFAYGNVDYSANTNFGNDSDTYPVKFTETQTGWTAGGGVEYAINNHWTVRAEYLHYDLGDESRTGAERFLDAPTGSPFAVRYNFETAGNIVRGGLNFKF
jgi:outer membrane immunogenic protein